jgi:hypothetical protein
MKKINEKIQIVEYQYFKKSNFIDLYNENIAYYP